MNSAQTKTMASIHQKPKSANRDQRSSLKIIQRPVAPASGIDHRILGRETVFDRLEKHPAAFRVRGGARERQGDERDEGDAADPVGDEQHMQGAGEFDVVNHCSQTGSRSVRPPRPEDIG